MTARSTLSFLAQLLPHVSSSVPQGEPQAVLSLATAAIQSAASLPPGDSAEDAARRIGQAILPHLAAVLPASAAVGTVLGLVADLLPLLQLHLELQPVQLVDDTAGAAPA
jgi:hypothetical protein